MENRSLTETQSREKLDSLAREAQVYAESVIMNIFCLGRVFVEAKKLVKHGEWGKWLSDNAGVSERTAQQFMGAYRRFGDRPLFQNVERAKLFSLLALPEGQEEAFMESHDVEDMSAREVREAVKQAKLEAEKEMRRLKDEAENAKAEAADELRRAKAEAEEAWASADRFAKLAKAEGEDRAEAERRNKRLQSELNDQEQLIREQQEEYDRVQAELLDIKSRQARQEDGKEPACELTVDVFRTAVSEFMGACARMPYMSRAFAAMDDGLKNSYDELLSVIEGFCRNARNALDVTVVSGGLE